MQREMLREENHIYSLWGNHEFSAMFAYLAAKNNNKKTLLLDFDMLNPSVDLILGIKKNPIKFEKNKSGLDLVVEMMEKNVFIPELFSEFSIKMRGINNFHILTGVSDIEQYEYIDINLVKKIIEMAKLSYDEIYLIVNDNPYDAITAYSFSIASDIIRCMPPTQVSFRYFNNIIMLFNNKQGVDFDTFKFIADTSLKSSISYKNINECVFGQYAGMINMDIVIEGISLKKIELEYEKIFYNLGICSSKKGGRVGFSSKKISNNFEGGYLCQ